jgi:ABC-type oligopeptide transport system ATPase subunit
MPPEPVLIEACDVSRVFAGRGGGFFRAAPTLRAVDRVSLTIHPGETVAVVGESGSGKSTLGRMLLGLTEPSEGSVLYCGTNIATLRGTARKEYRREVQVVFQDSGASLNPRRSAVESVALPLRHGLGLDPRAARERAEALLDRVGLPAVRFRDRMPHELSGGQRQRIGIARAIASEPRLIVADEPVSALDVSVRAQVLRLMLDLQRASGLAYLFITHDLGVVRAIADRVVVMYRGAVLESGDAGAVLERPQHDYTKRLLAAVPVPDPARYQTEAA